VIRLSFATPDSQHDSAQNVSAFQPLMSLCSLCQRKFRGDGYTQLRFGHSASELGKLARTGLAIIGQKTDSGTLARLRLDATV